MQELERNIFKLLTGGLGVIILLDILTHGAAFVSIVNAFGNLTTGFYKALRG